MLTIPEELNNYKNVVTEGALNNINTTITNISDKLSTLSTACTTAESGFSANYKSENKSKILNKFSNISEVLTKISNSVSNDLKPLLSKAKELLDDIIELGNLSSTVEEQEGIKSREMAKEPADRDNSLISEANRIISTSTSEFNTLKSTAEDLLSSLKSMDANLDFVTQFTSNDYLAHLDQLQYGTFEHKEYTASNGTKIEYYIYVPDYGQEVEKLPVHVYLHGSGENYTGVLNCALPALINDKSVTPAGIVICPQGHNNFSNKAYQNALIELIDKTVEEYNADSNRISLSGHSIGAIVGYELIYDHPDYFSAFVPISGRTYLEYDDKDVSTAVWAFHGAKDTSVPYDGGVKSVEKLKNAGADVDIYTFENEGHVKVQTYTFDQKYEYKDGKEYYVLDWAMMQTKEDK